jgi:excinuclease UvrABC ATPase subunit
MPRASSESRLDVSYRSLTEHERDIVVHGEPVQRQVTLSSGRTGRTVQLSVSYDNAVAAVERSLRSDNERTRRLVQRFLITRVCSVCHGTRMRPEALASQLGGRNITEISALGLAELREFAAGLPAGLPAGLSRLSTGLLAELNGTLTPLLDVGLGYLALDRPGATLSTGERQRIELTSTVRASTTGMLYVLDEPSVGLHPINVAGLRKTITALAGNGNSVVVVEHERDLIRSADWVIELGPGVGANGGTVIAQGTPAQLETSPRSIMGPFLAGAAAVPRDRPARPGAGGQIAIEISDLYNLHDLAATFPVHQLTALAGPSGAGKTALVLDSLIPAAGTAERVGAARARPPPGPRRHPPGRPDRRLADRPERAIDTRHLLRGVRPDPPPVRRDRARPAAELEARALLVQHPRRPVPHLPRARPHRPRRPVPARHRRRLPDLPRHPLQRRHPGRPGRRPDHSRRARPQRARRPGAVR